MSLRLERNLECREMFQTWVRDYKGLENLDLKCVGAVRHAKNAR